jgi:hypothetical protein
LGTYVAERYDEPCHYGLVKPISAPYNLLRIEFHVWMDMARDLARARSLGEAWGDLFGPPGWRPNGVGETTEDLRRRRDAGRMTEAAPAVAGDRPPLGIT